MDDAILTGGIKALEEAGYKMGDQVIAVGTVCNGDKQLITEGKEYGTTLQAPLLEGQLAELADPQAFVERQDAIRQVATATLEGYDGKTYPIDELCSGAWGK